MEENKVSQENVENVTLESLKEENKQFRAYITTLHQKINQMEEALVEKRLGVFFKVLENSVHFNEDFVDFCAKEIEGIFKIDMKKDGE